MIDPATANAPSKPAEQGRAAAPAWHFGRTGVNQSKLSTHSPLEQYDISGTRVPRVALWPYSQSFLPPQSPMTEMMDSAAKTLFAVDGGPTGLPDDQLDALLEQLAHDWILRPGVRRLLLLPPDHTRLFSFAGRIVAQLWKLLENRVEIDIMPALGTHSPMTEAQRTLMFGDDVPADRFILHRWREDLEPLGSLPASFLEGLSGGRMRSPVPVAVNRHIVHGKYDLVLSIGQVVPHEVIGFANYTKNVCIGCGGGEMLHQSHMLAAVCGIENVIGVIDNPVRCLVDEGFERCVRPRAAVRFVLTVVADTGEGPRLRAITAGDNRECFRWAAELSKDVNVTQVVAPIERCLVRSRSPGILLDVAGEQSDLPHAEGVGRRRRVDRAGTRGADIRRGSRD